LDTRFLESLMVVADTGSIAAAARQQGLTAAAISQRVRVLEVEFGETLLNRSAHAAVPTEACQRLLPAARKLVADALQLSSRIDSDGLSGPFRLGAVSTALLEFCPSVITAFRERAPKAVLTIRPGTSASLYEDLRAGMLDAVITVAAPFSLPKDVVSEPLVEQPIVHVLPAGGNTVTGKADRLPWIVYDRASWGGRQIWEDFGRDMSEGHILCELDALETIAAMVSQGSGQAILPLSRGLEEIGSKTCIRPLRGNTKRRMVFLHKDQYASPNLARLALSALQSMGE